MHDLYSQVTTVDPAVLDILIKAMELRAVDPRTRQMRERFYSSIDFPEGARVLEAGCGSGAICRELARWPRVGTTIGLDPSPVFLAKARELAADLPDLRFEEGDARSLPYEDGSFDVVVFHTCLTHVPGPEKALGEAFRVLRPGGRLAILDGDYATTTVAIGDNDPLQSCAGAAMSALVHDPWLVRRLPSLVDAAGFRVEGLDSHGYLQTAAPDYMLTLVERGADILSNAGRMGTALADGLKDEARRRADKGEFFGFIPFASLIAYKAT
jgi:SAM-dependent methyltransferase